MNAAKEETLRQDSLLTSYQVGTLLQVNPSSINKWVKDGRIPAFRTPGGHRRIRAADLVHFLVTHKMPIPPALRPVARRRVLIVEADAHHIEALQREAAAASAHIEAVCVNNAVDAMVQIGAFAPHLVLLDAQTPQLDIAETCRRLKGGVHTQSIAVVVACAVPDAGFTRRVLEAGAHACVTKPVGLTALLRELAAATQAIAS
jgi:excisionase family DNA binding protein